MVQAKTIPCQQTGPELRQGFICMSVLEQIILCSKPDDITDLTVYKTWISFIRESTDGTRKFWKLLKIYDSSDSDWARRMRGWTRVWPGEGATPGLSSGSPPRGDCRHPELLRKKRTKLWLAALSSGGTWKTSNYRHQLEKWSWYPMTSFLNVTVCFTSVSCRWRKAMGKWARLFGLEPAGYYEVQLIGTVAF